VGGTQRSSRPLHREHGPAGEDFVRVSALKDLVAAYTGTALRQEVNVVVLRLALPGRGGHADGDGDDGPGDADLPGMSDRQPPEPIEHATSFRERRAPTLLRGCSLRGQARFCNGEMKGRGMTNL